MATGGDRFASASGGASAAKGGVEAAAGRASVGSAGSGLAVNDPFAGAAGYVDTTFGYAGISGQSGIDENKPPVAAGSAGTPSAIGSAGVAGQIETVSGAGQPGSAGSSGVFSAGAAGRN